MQAKVSELNGNLLLKIDFDYKINIRDCVVNKATPYGLQVPGIETQLGKNFCNRPYGHWSSHSFQ